MKQGTLRRLVWATVFAWVTFVASAEAQTTEQPPGPWVGGHVGLAVQLFVFGKSTLVIGDDLGVVGLAPGITVHLNERWAIDFETVAYSDYKNDRSFFVVDPGLVYKFDFLSLGLRAAVNTVSLDNWGFIPIVNKGWRVGLIKLFVELDLPTFITHGQATMTVQPQFGVAF